MSVKVTRETKKRIHFFSKALTRSTRRNKYQGSDQWWAMPSSEQHRTVYTHAAGRAGVLFTARFTVIFPYSFGDVLL